MRQLFDVLFPADDVYIFPVYYSDIACNQTVYLRYENTTNSLGD